MFWFLHRSVIALFWCFWAVAAFWLYQQREAIQPAVDYVELWSHADQGSGRKGLEISGRVTRVFNGESFELKHASSWYFNYGLAGVEAPKVITSFSAAEKRAFLESRTNLVRLIHNANVRIDVTLANPETRTGLGVVWVGKTNVNLAQIAAGAGRLKREQLRTLPVREAYEYVRAERIARKAGRGLWSGAEAEDSADARPVLSP